MVSLFVRIYLYVYMQEFVSSLMKLISRQISLYEINYISNTFTLPNIIRLRFSILFYDTFPLFDDLIIKLPK